MTDNKLVLKYFSSVKENVGEILTVPEARLLWDKHKLTYMFDLTSSIIRPKVYSEIRPGVLLLLKLVILLWLTSFSKHENLVYVTKSHWSDD